MSNKDKIAALKRFLANESEYSEAEKMSKYLKSNTQELDSIDLFDNLPDDKIIRVSDADKKRALQKILGRRTAVIRLLYKTLAAASIVAIIFYVGWDVAFNHLEKEFAIIKTAPIKVVNNTNAVKRYTLPDSTTVLLKPEAEIIYQSDFINRRNVEVSLGEAYFQVYKNKAKPFVVAVNGINVTAIGTEFWIQNFKDQNKVNIVLTEGKVRISANGNEFKMKTIYLDPGYHCLIDLKTGNVSVGALNKMADLKNTIKGKPSNIASNVKWTNSGIEFQNTPIQSVLTMLKNRYRVEFAGDLHMLTGHLTGKIYYTDSLDTVIKSICELNNMQYERKDDTIFLKRKN